VTTDQVVRLHDVPVLVCAADGPPVQTDGDALNLIAEALGHQVDLVAIPVARLPDDFFALGTGLAGVISQKFVNYRLRLAIVGDITRHDRSSALRAFVAEANRGGQLWFVADLAELETRLTRTAT
jgi:hypothetical protein